MSTKATKLFQNVANIFNEISSISDGDGWIYDVGVKEGVGEYDVPVYMVARFRLDDEGYVDINKFEILGHIALNDETVVFEYHDGSPLVEVSEDE